MGNRQRAKKEDRKRRRKEKGWEEKRGKGNP
jgi:hypothetical protein